MWNNFSLSGEEPAWSWQQYLDTIPNSKVNGKSITLNNTVTESNCLTEPHPQISKLQNNNKKNKRRDPLVAALCFLKSCWLLQKKAEQLASQPDGHNVPASIKRQRAHVLRSFCSSCGSSAGAWVPRGGGERPKGRLGQILPSTSWDSWIHTSHWHDLEDVGGAQMVPKEGIAEGSGCILQGRCCQKHSLCCPGCAGSCTQRLRKIFHTFITVKHRWNQSGWKSAGG